MNGQGPDGHAGATTRGASVASLWGPDIVAMFRRLLEALSQGYLVELEERRLFLWLPVAAGIGVILFFCAAVDPVAWYAPLLAFGFGVGAIVVRDHRNVAYALIGLCAVAAGFGSAEWRQHCIAAPVVTRIMITQMSGFVEQLDLRPVGARFVLRVASADNLPDGVRPYRVRLTMRQTPKVQAGDFVWLKARLLPPSHAVLPGGYDFARDAYFARLGAVGSVLGAIEVFDPPEPPGLMLAGLATIDRARNRLAQRVNSVVGGDEGAIAAAMVTGKRDLLSKGTRELIREAGIFHIITISGIQMTLVAGILFWTFRRVLAMSEKLALNFPIKKWAAVAAMLGATIYDIGTGSRVGTERALVMTLVLFCAILFDRAALTMRNLAFAALAVIIFEPDALLGASFQLSFAAVAALVAVHEARTRAMAVGRDQARQPGPQQIPPRTTNPAREEWFRAARAHLQHLWSHNISGILIATFCATSATASFMAYDFHELSLYVMVGNPLTLGLIELFAIPGALIGTALYPLGLDAPVWHYVGLGITLVLKVARIIAAAPGASLAVPAFPPIAICLLALGILSAVIWRTWVWRATAVPFVLAGLFCASFNVHGDIIIAPTGDALVYRTAQGRFALLGKRRNDFAVEQWLRADGDPRPPTELSPVNDESAGCDDLGCAAKLPSLRSVALVLKPQAFNEDCERAAIIVTPLFAPSTCKAQVYDHAKLASTGAVMLRFKGKVIAEIPSRLDDEDRPWSPKPKVRIQKYVAFKPTTLQSHEDHLDTPTFR